MNKLYFLGQGKGNVGSSAFNPKVLLPEVLAKRGLPNIKPTVGIV